mmetsp:Transcript_57626/g.178940  ORF Transcript_57626/g.178940 Transcript_57626/m.178940 type:complete len:246 (+) Transcript_57626:900-1637(+)
MQRAFEPWLPSARPRATLHRRCARPPPDSWAPLSADAPTNRRRSGRAATSCASSRRPLHPAAAPRQASWSPCASTASAAGGTGGHATCCGCSPGHAGSAPRACCSGSCARMRVLGGPRPARPPCRAWRWRWSRPSPRAARRRSSPASWRSPRQLPGRSPTTCKPLASAWLLTFRPAPATRCSRSGPSPCWPKSSRPWGGVPRAPSHAGPGTASMGWSALRAAAWFAQPCAVCASQPWLKARHGRS